MLVLGRREGQSVLIDLTEHGLGMITVTVTRISAAGEFGMEKPAVRLGFDADRRIHISRAENHDPAIHKRKMEELASK